MREKGNNMNFGGHIIYLRPRSEFWILATAFFTSWGSFSFTLTPLFELFAIVSFRIYQNTETRTRNSEDEGWLVHENRMMGS